VPVLHHVLPARPVPAGTADRGRDHPALPERDPAARADPGHRRPGPVVARALPRRHGHRRPAGRGPPHRHPPAPLGPGARCTRPRSTPPRSGSGCEIPSPNVRDTPGKRINELRLTRFSPLTRRAYAPGGHDTRLSPYSAGGGNGNYPGTSTSACTRSTSLAPFPDAVALARGSARLGPAGAAA